MKNKKNFFKNKKYYILKKQIRNGDRTQDN